MIMWSGVLILSVLISMYVYLLYSYSCPDRCPIPAPGLYGCPSVTVLKYVSKLAENGPITVSKSFKNISW